MRSLSHPRPDATRGFTLIEVLVTLAIVIIIMAALGEFVSQVQRSWKLAAADPYAEAENAFDGVVRNLSAATLEPYQDYADTQGAFRTDPTFVPDHPARRSDLAFVCGPGAGPRGLLTPSGRTAARCGVFFVAPQGYTQADTHTGLERLLNTVGYFVEFGDDNAAPAFLPSSAHRWRWRLKEVRQPAEGLQIFALPTSAAWIGQAVQPGTPTPILAENVIALIVLPERAHDDFLLAPDFRYDSRNAGNPLTRHQLPACLRVALVAIDEPSAILLTGQNGTNPPALVTDNLFQQASQLDADLASLDQALIARKIGHRIFQREIQVSSAAWSTALSQ